MANGSAHQEREVRQRGGGVASEGEREQEQHLDALGEIGVHVGRDALEAVRAQVAGDQAEVIGDAIRTHLRGHRVEEVEHEEDGEDGAEEPFPEGGQRSEVSP